MATNRVASSTVVILGLSVPSSSCEPGAAANGAGTLLSGARRLSQADGVPINHHLGCSAFAEHAVVSRRSLVKLDPALCVETSLDIDAGAAAMAALLARRPDVRAVFCSADAIAVGALFECQRQGLAIPDRIAVAGFDDMPLAGQVVPPLTTLRVPRYEIGRRAGEMIRARLARQPIEAAIVDCGFEFVARASA